MQIKNYVWFQGQLCFQILSSSLNVQILQHPLQYFIVLAYLSYF